MAKNLQGCHKDVGAPFTQALSPAYILKFVREWYGKRKIPRLLRLDHWMPKKVNETPDLRKRWALCVFRDIFFRSA